MRFDVANEESDPDDRFRVGLNYGAPTVRVRLSDLAHVEGEFLTSVTEVGFSVGAGGALLIGDPYGSKLTLGFESIQVFGERFYSKLDKSYRTSPEKYEMTDTGGVQQTAVSKAFAKAGKKLLFVFDYDAEWCFEVELVKVAGKKPGTRYPRLINSSGDAPEQYPMDED